jgi:geranylgeranyl diphosphate synthase, type II
VIYFHACYFVIFASHYQLMHQIKKWQEQIESAIAAIPFNNSPVDLYEPIKYTLAIGGKRMRPVLVLMGCDLFDGDIEKAMSAATGIEVFHNFTLLHDDIMDNAPLRRNFATVHTKWNPNVAILSGDTMFVKSFQLMMQVEEYCLRNVLDLFCKTATEVCEGQQMDMDFERLTNVSIVDYIKMISLKTSVLLACSLKTGALIAGANAADANHLYEFGKNIGIAFQIQDDLLDAYADKEKFGKQVGGDIIANKKTILYLKALEVANAEQKKVLLDIYSGKLKLNQEDKVKKVKGIFDELKIPQATNNYINAFYNEGLKHFNQINVAEEKRKELLSFSEGLMKREI